MTINNPQQRIRFTFCRGGALSVTTLLLWFAPMAAGESHKIDVLTTSKAAYTNVTVTGKNGGNIFIRHDGGVGNIKVQDLEPDMQRTLGYAVSAAGASGYASSPQGKTHRTDSISLGKLRFSNGLNFLASIPGIHLNSSMIIGVATGALLAYLFFCYCCASICRKTGSEPGPLVWVPIVQLFPLLRAAGMSGWWFLAWCIPVLNFIAQILWSVRIVRARDKNIGWAILLILPGINLIPFLYLALSSATPAIPERPVFATEPLPA